MKGANEIVRCLTNVLNLLFGSILFYFIDMSLFFIRSISEFIVMAANTEPFEKLNLPHVLFIYLVLFFKYIEQQKTTNKLKAKETKYLII
jgi:hypothetical protein